MKGWIDRFLLPIEPLTANLSAQPTFLAWQACDFIIINN